MMDFKVDPAFEGSGQRAKERRRARFVTRAVAAIGGLAALVLSAYVFSKWPDRSEDNVALEKPIDDFQIVQVEEAATPGIRVDPLASFINLPRDPMILRLQEDDAGKSWRIPGPQNFVPSRAGAMTQDRLTVIRDALLVTETRLVTALPSTRHDFALFDAKRSGALTQTARSEGPVPAGQIVSSDDSGSWGDLIKTDLDGDETEATYRATYLDDPTSNAITLRENLRTPLFEDSIIVLRRAQMLADILANNGISDSETALIAKAVARLTSIEEELETGSTVALRLRGENSQNRLLQVSIYGPEGYRATLAQIGAGRFAVAADPWQSINLLDRNDAVRGLASQIGDIRLLDALYSAAIRNGVPTRLVGELIVIMSQRFDLDRFVDKEDTVTILFATDPGPTGQGLGRLLYAGVEGPSGTISCYVTLANTPSGFECHDFDAPAAFAPLASNLIVPVRGVTTSGFGPRLHPILKQVRRHNGVDWRAPIGTPVYAAAAGKVTIAGDGGGYGNVVYLDHGNGMETRYAHLNAFSPNARVGTQVKTGDVIGFVGTTGRSTGPHLHFELHVGGSPVDPMLFLGSGAGTHAVEALVNQIIRVESAGVATAKNPRSSATGLGQFINSTWLRMMRDYRPDLVRSMSRAQLLALRTDPTLSREMVRNLARENESYLRQRNHIITPGKLYLAHFLGPAGAHEALRADGAKSVGEVMGASVVRANPFLRGKTIADLRAWSDRKMGGAGRAATNPPPTKQVQAIPAEVKAYRNAVDKILTAI